MKPQKISIPKGQTPLETQFALEQKLEFVVQRLNEAGAWCRLEYGPAENEVKVFASNGQRVEVRAV